MERFAPDRQINSETYKQRLIRSIDKSSLRESGPERGRSALRTSFRAVWKNSGPGLQKHRHINRDMSDVISNKNVFCIYDIRFPDCFRKFRFEPIKR